MSARDKVTTTQLPYQDISTKSQNKDKQNGTNLWWLFLNLYLNHICITYNFLTNLCIIWQMIHKLFTINRSPPPPPPILMWKKKKRWNMSHVRLSLKTHSSAPHYKPLPSCIIFQNCLFFISKQIICKWVLPFLWRVYAYNKFKVGDHMMGRVGQEVEVDGTYSVSLSQLMDTLLMKKCSFC